MIKESDVRITPAWLLDMVREFAGGQIGLDPCTEPHNPTDALMYFTSEMDGLNERWGGPERGLIWVNPPYSTGQVIAWATKSAASALNGAEILFLTKDDCRPKWNRFLRDNADERCRIDKGVGFLEPDEDGGFRQLVGPQWGSCLWYFGRHRRRFGRVFSRIGEVIHGLGPQELM